jgi:predicted enzyme related to lactoylglutathione lyase
MKFICLGYADMSKFQTMPPEVLQRSMDECFAYDDFLRAGGHFAGGEALQESSKAITLRCVDGAIQATDGPYAETKEQIGGILILEAESMEHAVELMSRHPGVGIGPFEIRPSDEATNALINARNQPKPRNPVAWFEIYVADMVRAKRFYEAVLQVELSQLESPDSAIEMFAFPMNMNGDGASGALAKMEGNPPGGTGTLVYFACQDCGLEASRVESSGGKLLQGKTPIGPYGYIALAMDTEGNRIGLHSMN